MSRWSIMIKRQFTLTWFRSITFKHVPQMLLVHPWYSKLCRINIRSKYWWVIAQMKTLYAQIFNVPCHYLIKLENNFKYNILQPQLWIKLRNKWKKSSLCFSNYCHEFTDMKVAIMLKHVSQSMTSNFFVDLWPEVKRSLRWHLCFQANFSTFLWNARNIFWGLHWVNNHPSLW